jgi:predicted phosphodiesterase
METTWKIAVLSDIHGNFPALEACLKQIERERCQEIFVLGDSVGIGPYVNETLDRLLSRKDIVMLLGNQEQQLIHGLQAELGSMSRGELQHHRWVKGIIKPEYLAKMKTLKMQTTRCFGETTVRMQHYAYGVQGKFYAALKDPTAEALDSLFSISHADLALYGHSHCRSDVHSTHSGTRYLNPGALGTSRQGVARLLILQFSTAGFAAHWESVPYDLALVMQEMERREVPDRLFLKKIFFE